MIDDGGIRKEEFDNRIRKCLSEMESKNIDVMFVYGDSAYPGNLIYLTNYRPIGADFPGNNGYEAIFLLFKDGSSTLVIDREWYLSKAKEESTIEDIVAEPSGNPLELACEILKKRNKNKAKIEADTKYMSADFYIRFMEKLGGATIDRESRIVQKLRSIKSEKEIEIISKINDICGEAMGAAFSLAKEGVREMDIAAELWRVAMGEGAEFMKSQMVQAGPRSTTGLASPQYTRYKIKNGDMMMVCVWCCYKKYIAGIDRGWVVGKASKKQIKLSEIELKGLEESIRIAKPGCKIADYVERVYGNYTEPLLREAGFTDYTIQAYVGHSYGLHGHESPILWKHEPGVLKPGMIIHIEPGIYSKDPTVGGIRTADTIVITDEGSRNLTKYPRRVGDLAQYC